MSEGIKKSFISAADAGKWECSLLSVFNPEAVRLDLLRQGDKWFIIYVQDTNNETGAEMLRLSFEDPAERIRINACYLIGAE